MNWRDIPGCAGYQVNGSYSQHKGFQWRYA